MRKGTSERVTSRVAAHHFVQVTEVWKDVAGFPMESKGLCAGEDSPVSNWGSCSAGGVGVILARDLMAWLLQHSLVF